MQVTQDPGLTSIKASEGWSAGPYLDRLPKPPVWTAYYGETDGINSRSPRISMAEGAKRLLAKFNRLYAWALKPFTTLKGFTQNMYDALASFIWNCGTGAVSKATKVGRFLRAKSWGAAANAMLEWANSGGVRLPGLYARRQRERKLFLTPTVVKAVRAIKLTKTEKFHVDRLRAERRTADRHGGWEKVSASHNHNAEVSKDWLRKHATAMAGGKVQDKPYRDRKVEYLRDVALDRDGLGR